MLRPALLALSTLLCASLITPAQAQLLPPRGIGNDRDYIQPAQSQDAASALLRIDRLENQVRTLTGQLEQSQFQVKRLEDALKKFQQDVEFRFQEQSSRPASRPAPAPAPARPQQRGDLNDQGYTVITEAPAQPQVEPAPTRLSRRGDAFDPEADPAAPGAPRNLGTLASEPAIPAGRTGDLYAGPLGNEDDPDAPLDLMRGATPRPAQPAQAPAAPQVLAGVSPVARPAIDPTGPAVASIAPPAGPRDEFDVAANSLKGGQYEAAETGFRTFLQKYPKDRLASDATFFLGESYFRRSRPREAAEQYLKVSTDFARTPRAPEALIKLGLSLEKLGAREQACAAYGEVGRKYPNSSTAIRTTAERESKRAQC
jgi:tol-pal system protein YbgF